MFGCHKCTYRIKENAKYEDTPCATCRTQKNPPPVSHYAEDPSTFSSLQVLHPSLEEDWESRDALQDVLHAFGRVMRLLMELREKNPSTYQVVFAKIRNPEASYRELAQRFSCRKQNILYHLRRAVELYPELDAALLVDSRFSNGRNALKRTGKFFRETAAEFRGERSVRA